MVMVLSWDWDTFGEGSGFFWGKSPNKAWCSICLSRVMVVPSDTRRGALVLALNVDLMFPMLCLSQSVPCFCFSTSLAVVSTSEAFEVFS